MRFMWIVLVPALALAGPRGPNQNRKRRPTPAADKLPAEEPAQASETPDSAPTTPTGTNAAEPQDPGPKPEPKPSGQGSLPGGGTTVSPAANRPAEKPDAQAIDVDNLRQEYLSLRDELFRSRARASAVSGQLYSSRIEIRFTWSSGRFYGVSKASVRLDGATVFDDATGAIAGNDGVRFSGFVAPGRHTLTFHVEATGKDDDSFTSSTDAQVVVKAVANKDLLVAAKAHDAGDIAYQWKRSETGNYGLGIDVAVKTTASTTPTASKAKR